MASWTAVEIYNRAREAENARQSVYGWIDQALRYCMPWRRRHARPGDMDRVFDSTALVGVTRFANRLQREFTPPFQRWLELKAGPLVPEEHHGEVNRELELASHMIRAVLDASAFGKASHEAYGDLSIGTMALLITEGDDLKPIRVTSCAAWQLGVEEGPDGVVQNVYLDEQYPAWILCQKWPKAEWPDRIRKLISERSTQLVRVLQASYYDDEIRKWRLAIVVDAASDNRGIVQETIRRSNPWAIPRWWTTPGNPWGWGPVMMAMPDVRTMNKTVEMVLKAAAYQLAPPLMVLHDGIVNPDRMRMAPAALIQVARTGGPMGRSIEPLDIGGNTNLSQIVLADTREGVKKTLLDQGLPPPSAGIRSAAEIISQQKEMSYDGGAAFGRLNQELVPVVVSAVIDVLDLKRVAFVQWNKLQIDHLQLRVNVLSPLARVQNLDDAQQIVQAAQTVIGLFGPEAFMQSAMIEKVPSHLLGLLGMPDSLIRTAREREALAKAAGAVMQAQHDAGAAEGDPAGAGQPPAGAQPAPFQTPQPGMMMQ